MGPNGPGIDVAAKWSSRVQGSDDPVGVGPLLRAGWEPLKKLAEPEVSGCCCICTGSLPGTAHLTGQLPGLRLVTDQLTAPGPKWAPSPHAMMV